VNRSFLPREALYALVLGAPAITALISSFGPTDAHRAVACLLSTWTCTIAVGACLHVVVNLVWRASRDAPAAMAATLVALAGALTIVTAMLALMPRLVWLDANLAGNPSRFVIQALVVGAIYVVVARLVGWHAERRARARLAALQAQLNPHFLFNALSTIASMIPRDPQGAERTIERLASLMQYALASSARERVAVADEIDVVRDYLDIERARFGARLRSSIEVDHGAESLRVPPMLLQPLVENAVLHGLAGREQVGAVTVRARVEARDVVIEVHDDGVGHATTHRGNKTALANLRERLALAYGPRARLTTRASDAGGFASEIRLPR